MNYRKDYNTAGKLSGSGLLALALALALVITVHFSLGSGSGSCYYRNSCTLFPMTVYSLLCFYLPVDRRTLYGNLSRHNGSHGGLSQRHATFLAIVHRLYR